MRRYRKENNLAVAHSDTLVTMCPSRFLDSNTIFSWVGETLLGEDKLVILKELPFLMSRDSSLQKPVGKIDMVLIDPEANPLQWCALEMQAVYFSGHAMSSEFKFLKTWDKEGIPFPQEIRRPDFRSSGPKRLMPQLQIKVPTISRWGKKTAVVIDRSFWDSLGSMDEVDSLSNCDIAWFIVSYRERDASPNLNLVPDSLHLTTLNRAVEGLTGGIPTSLNAFEQTLRQKLSAIRE